MLERIGLDKVFGWIKFIVGIILFLLIAPATLGIVFDNERDGAVTIVIAVGLTWLGFWMIYSGWQKTRTAKRYERYIPYVKDNCVVDMDVLAAALNMNRSRIVSDFKRMMQKGCFEKASFDMYDRLLTIGGGNSPVPTVNNSSGNINAAKTEEVYTTVICPNCGGVNKIVVHGVGECEYCGSPIQADN